MYVYCRSRMKTNMRKIWNMIIVIQQTQTYIETVLIHV